MAYTALEQRYLDRLASLDFPPAPVEEQPAEPSLDGVQLAMGGSGAGKYKTDQTMTDAGMGLMDMGAATVKGAAQGFVGLPGDLEGLARSVINLMGGSVDENTKLPTTEEIKGWLDKFPMTRVGDGKNPYETIGEFLSPSGYSKAAKGAVKGAQATAKAVAPVAGEMVENYLTKTGAILKMAPDSPGIEVPAAPKLNTPAFKKWFGDSKVVDDKGQPLVVYHGSPDARFVQEDGIFKSTKERLGMRENDPERAFFFAADKRTAGTYADDRRAFDYQNAEPGIIPTYISLQNPMVIDAKGADWTGTRNAMATARSAGHDGVVIKNVRDEYNNPKTGGNVTTVYVAFNPEQIKSVFNKGTWDPKDPRMMYGGGAAAVTGTAAQDKEKK